MSIDLLLKSHLKTLKLPTILQEYSRAARQCAQENWKHARKTEPAHARKIEPH